VVVGCSLRWPIMQFGNSGGKNEYLKLASTFMLALRMLQGRRRFMLLWRHELFLLLDCFSNTDPRLA
jgi:hypothetical protein